MDLDARNALTRQGDVGEDASRLRFQSALLVTGMSQKEFAQMAGVGTTALANMLAGRSFPNRKVMQYLYRAHRIDFNFLMNGDYAQLPGDVSERLFATLREHNKSVDQTPHLG